jgi:hypothetical protein
VDDYTIINNYVAAHHAGYDTELQRIPARKPQPTRETCSRTKACHSMPNWHHTRTARGNMRQRRGGLCKEIHKRDNREHHAVAGVLLDLGGNDCLFVLIDALNGNTQIPRHQAASYIQAFHSKYRWDTARLREVNGLVDAALDYLADDGGISGVNLVHRLRLTEAVPILRQIQARADPSLQTRIQAAIADIEAVAAIDED